jgi:5-methylcytosine-specific restriction endonuclease McrA
MSEKKKAVRKQFRQQVLDRDGHKCRCCGVVPPGGDDALDAHHITDRTLIPNGGYVKENGISVCPDCHLKAEQFHITGTGLPSYSPHDLYTLIGSSVEKAYDAARKL